MPVDRNLNRDWRPLYVHGSAANSFATSQLTLLAGLNFPFKINLLRINAINLVVYVYDSVLTFHVDNALFESWIALEPVAGASIESASNGIFADDGTYRTGLFYPRGNSSTKVVLDMASILPSTEGIEVRIENKLARAFANCTATAYFSFECEYK